MQCISMIMDEISQYKKNRAKSRFVHRSPNRSRCSEFSATYVIGMARPAKSRWLVAVISRVRRPVDVVQCMWFVRYRVIAPIQVSIDSPSACDSKQRVSIVATEVKIETPPPPFSSMLHVPKRNIAVLFTWADIECLWTRVSIEASEL